MQSNIEKDFKKQGVEEFELDLLNKARYIHTKACGTIDVYSILRSVYEQGKTDTLRNVQTLRST